MSDSLKESIRHYTTHHYGHNTSYHSSLFLSFDINSCNETSTYKEESFIDKPMWTLASADNICCYRSDLDKVLPEWTFPGSFLNCENPMCTNTSINELPDHIIHACISSSSVNRLSRKPTSRNVLPGWNNHIKLHCERAIFWQNIFKTSGSPQQGKVANIRHSTRPKYHRVVSSLKEIKTLYVQSCSLVKI